MQDQAQEAALRGVEALEAATGVSRGSADQMEEDEDDEIDDEIDPDDEDEELAMQQPPVHDVHVSSEAVVAAGTSGRDRVPDPSRLVNLAGPTLWFGSCTLRLSCSCCCCNPSCLLTVCCNPLCAVPHALLMFRLLLMTQLLYFKHDALMTVGLQFSFPSSLLWPHPKSCKPPPPALLALLYDQERQSFAHTAHVLQVGSA